jgi:hypothetical protein
MSINLYRIDVAISNCLPNRLRRIIDLAPVTNIGTGRVVAQFTARRGRNNLAWKNGLEHVFHDVTSRAFVRTPFGQDTQPTSKPLGNTDFTLASSMNFGRRSEPLMRIDAAAT